MSGHHLLAHPSLERELRKIADVGGVVQVIEGECPMPPHLAALAEEAGLLTSCLSGGAGGFTEDYALTDDGRALFGLPPQQNMPEWMQALIDAVRASLRGVPNKVWPRGR